MATALPLIFGAFLGLITLITAQNMSLPAALVPYAKDDLNEPQSSPGIRARWTAKGLDYVCFVAAEVLAYKMGGVKIPDFSKDLAGPGSGTVSASNMKIVSFKPLKFWYKLKGPHQLVWGSADGFVQVAGDWSGRYKTMIAIKGKGTFQVEASKINLTIGAEFNKTRHGSPHLQVKQCSADVADLSINIKGGIIGWFVNTFRSKIAEQVRVLLDTKLCEEATNLINVQANVQLGTLPTLLPINRFYLMNNQLLASPSVTDAYIDAPLKGEVSFNGEGKTPFNPAPLPVKNETNRMLYIWGSDYVVNSLISAAYRQKLLIYGITAKSFPEMAAFLRTSCGKADSCIGSVFDKLRKNHSNRSVEIYVQVAHQPIVVVNTARVIMEAEALGQMYVELDNGTAAHLLSFYTKFRGTLQLFIQDSKVTGILRILRLNLNVTDSKIGRFTEAEMDLFMVLAEPFIEQFVNGKLKQGLPIPKIKDLQFVDPLIVFNDRAIEIQSDMKFMHFEQEI